MSVVHRGFRRALLLPVVTVAVTTAATLRPAAAQGQAQDVAISPSARVSFDTVGYVGGEADIASTAFVRSVRLGMTATLAEDDFFKVEFDLAEREVEWENIHAGRSWGRHAVTVGERKVPLSLNRVTSAGSLLFGERAAPVDVLTDSSRFGLHYSWREPVGPPVGRTAQTMLFTRSANDDEHDAPVGLAQRLVLHREDAHGRVLHAGAAVAAERLDREQTVRLRGGPEARLERGEQYLLDTEEIDEVTEVITSGVEAAYQNPSLSVQAELLRKDLLREDGPSLTFRGGYVQLSWRPNGEPLSYDGNRFGDPSGPPADHGAWEWVARYARLDLQDGPYRGGRQDTVTAGVNWHVSRRVVYKANIVRHRIRNSDATVRGTRIGNEDAAVVLLRAQLQI